MARRKNLEKIYREFGFGATFDPYPSGIDTADLASAVRLGTVIELVYGSDKEGQWTEYEHEYQSRPALYRLGAEDGEKIEALLDVAEDDLRDVVLLGQFIELTYEDDDEQIATIEEIGWLYYEPTSNLLLIETESDKYAIAGFRVGRWLMG